MKALAVLMALALPAAAQTGTAPPLTGPDAGAQHAGPMLGQTPASASNDYPTNARADFVFTCMAANGQTREVLDRCSCVIDTIASIIPFDQYVQAETVLTMRNAPGDRMAVFRSPALTNGVVADLRRAEAEGNLMCF